jgi:TolB-like protein
MADGVGEGTTSANGHLVFVSYASKDAGEANVLVESLERAGLPCWIAPRDVEPGSLYADEIVGAINDARVVVLVLSAHSVGSPHVGKELERASSKQRRIIALRMDATPLPRAFEYFLSESQWVEVGPEGIEPAAAKLADSVRRHLGTGPGASGEWPESTPAAQRASGRRFSSTALTLAAVLALALAGTALWKFWPSQPASATAAPAGAIAEPSIAVLPFVNMSSDKEQEYFADGLSEELLNQLAQVPKLRVIGRTSSFSFKGKNEDLRKIGELLGVNHILEGSVRKAGNRLRITAQLINPADGSHLWSETYDREMDNVFEIQDEIAMAVSQKLQLTLNGSGRVTGGTQNVAAYEAYLLGLSKLRTTQPEMLRQAAKHFEEATRLDPDFDLAWVSLVSANNAIIAMIPGEREDALRKNERIRQRALSETPGSLVARIARYQLAIGSRDFATARKIARDVPISEAANVQGAFNFSYGSLLLSLGEPSAAIDFFAEARRKDPLVGLYSTFMMIAQEMAGQYELAEKEYRVALAAPNPAVVITEGSALVLAIGRRDRPAIDRLLPRAIEAGPDGSRVNQIARKHLDDAPSARRELRKLVGDPRLQGAIFDMAAIAQWAAYFGDDELALDAMQRLSKSGANFGNWALTLWRSTNQSTRRLPGFKVLLREAGFVDYWRKNGQWNEFCKPAGADDFECR